MQPIVPPRQSHNLDIQQTYYMLPPSPNNPNVSSCSTPSPLCIHSLANPSPCNHLIYSSNPCTFNSPIKSTHQTTHPLGSIVNITYVLYTRTRAPSAHTPNLMDKPMLPMHTHISHIPHFIHSPHHAATKPFHCFLSPPIFLITSHTFMHPNPRSLARKPAPIKPTYPLNFSRHLLTTLYHSPQDPEEVASTTIIGFFQYNLTRNPYAYHHLAELLNCSTTLHTLSLLPFSSSLAKKPSIVCLAMLRYPHACRHRPRASHACSLETPKHLQ